MLHGDFNSSSLGNPHFLHDPIKMKQTGSTYVVSINLWHKKEQPYLPIKE